MGIGGRGPILKKSLFFSSPGCIFKGALSRGPFFTQKIGKTGIFKSMRFSVFPPFFLRKGRANTGILAQQFPRFGPAQIGLKTGNGKREL